MRLPVLVAAVLALAACARAPAPVPRPAAQAPDPGPARRIEADVRFLADDLLEGRETGSRGYDLAALYVAQRFAAIGLEPAGEDGGWYQTVPLLKGTRVREGARFAIRRDGRTVELAFAEQYLPGLNYHAQEHRLEAPAVFVGQGVHAPELGHDDFAGAEVRGRIAVLFSGAPARFSNDERAYHASTRRKLEVLSERGAVGVVFLNSAEDEARAPWARAAANWDKPGMRLRGADGAGIDTFPQLQASASVSAAAADVLFAGTPHTAARLYAAVQAGRARAFELPGTLLLAGRTTLERLDSRNVVGRLRGSGEALANEHVVYTAHLDHVGIGAPVEGDAIYNGALDNALGMAILLEAAHILRTTPNPPKRSMLFVALTAEEKGLLGAEWFVREPTVPRSSLVANINLDMPVLLAPSRDVVPIGVEHSTLAPLVRQAAQELGLPLSPDPFPEEVVFVRSDQYAFVRAGIPAVYLDGGILPARAPQPGQPMPAATPANDPRLALRDFLRRCYHQPCDDTRLPIQYADAARLARLNARIGVLAGNVAERPKWNQGDFFGERFGRAALRAH